MNRLTLALAAATATAMTAGAASADTGWYATAGYTHYDLDGASPGGLTGRVGYNITPNFAVEGELGLGVVEDSVVELGVPLDITVDRALGAFAVGKLPVSDTFEVFARIGYGELKIEASTSGVSDSGTTDGVAGGIGAVWMLDKQLGLRGEWTRLEGDDDGDADTYSLSAVFKF